MGPTCHNKARVDLLDKLKMSKKALLIGINYFGTYAELEGCVNDVAKVKDLIITRGFEDSPDLMRVLVDNEDNTSVDPDTLPTRENILDGMHSMHSSNSTS